MLKKLSIQNYAIIQELEVVFQKGMIIITGETGAGKSILMGALGLALGERADGSMFRNREKKTIIEVEFELTSLDRVNSYFEELDLDPDACIIIRREFSSTGKSRAFINDTPVPLNGLQRMASVLVDLHQQFETLELSNREFQREMLDAWVGGVPALNSYQTVFNQLSHTRKAITALHATMLKAQQEKEYWDFLLDELMNLNWQLGETKRIEEELNTLTHAEQIRTGLGKMVGALQEGEQPMVARLRTIVSQLQSLSGYHQRLEIGRAHV